MGLGGKDGHDQTPMRLPGKAGIAHGLEGALGPTPCRSSPGPHSMSLIPWAPTHVAHPLGPNPCRSSPPSLTRFHRRCSGMCVARNHDQIQQARFVAALPMTFDKVVSVF